MLTALLVLPLVLSSGDGVPVRVDSRVELLTLVFRLIGAGEYDQPGARSPYSREADELYQPALEHEVFQRARKLRAEHGIGSRPPSSACFRACRTSWPPRRTARP
ncbi:MAG: hypothetical protein EXS08_10615 [Planctomycetes bacterium]|nr:hypothetical protein [Planctomycetota bacterium]